MKELYQSIKEAVAEEQERAKEIYGEINHSDHESKSIIEEQRDDAQREGGEFDYWFANFWALSKRDKEDDLQIVKEKRRCLGEMLAHAESAACEWVQVAAMCKKATVTLNNRTGEEE